MSVTYTGVGWNANKRRYDLVIAAGVIGYVATFLVVSRWAFGGAFSDEILLIRAFGTCALLMLHLVLCIGPLARLDRRFLPILYNRRHLGVATCLVALAHGALATGYYHGFGEVGPLVSLLSINSNYASVPAFPFEILGLMGLVLLLLLAATSHDFWQKNLGASAWKSLHMLVYVAYGFVILHVALGALQSEPSPVYVLLLVVGVMTVVGLHVVTGLRERSRDVGKASPLRTSDDWIDVGTIDEIPLHRAKIVCIPGEERIAIFRHAQGVSAVTNLCAHQRGPLGEGKIVDGCITCPWHGWQYLPATGHSPPPFTEKIATYPVQLIEGRVYLNPRAVQPAALSSREESTHA